MRLNNAAARGGSHAWRRRPAALSHRPALHQRRHAAAAAAAAGGGCQPSGAERVETAAQRRRPGADVQLHHLDLAHHVVDPRGA